MKADQVRSTFTSFFAERGHQVVRSAALVPENDPTLLFTNAGMNQFKDVFTGREKRSIARATTSQKCVRAGGKHNDLDEVGKTPRHHTFFEMLGNFSFGDYFKQDAIAWAWELLTGTLGIDPDRLMVTVFGGDKQLGVGADDEARAIWREVTGFPERQGGRPGHVRELLDDGRDRAHGAVLRDPLLHARPARELPRPPPRARARGTAGSRSGTWCSCSTSARCPAGPLDPLPAPSIDTGAGLERLTSVLQGVGSNYDTDLFTPHPGPCRRASPGSSVRRRRPTATPRCGSSPTTPGPARS